MFLRLVRKPAEIEKDYLAIGKSTLGESSKNTILLPIRNLGAGMCCVLSPKRQTYSILFQSKVKRKHHAPWISMVQIRSKQWLGVPVLVCLDSLLMLLQNFGIKTQLFGRGTAKAHH